MGSIILDFDSFLKIGFCSITLNNTRRGKTQRTVSINYLINMAFLKDLVDKAKTKFRVPSKRSHVII